MQAGAVGSAPRRASCSGVGEGGRPIPSRLAGNDEVNALCDVLGEFGTGNRDRRRDHVPGVSRARFGSWPRRSPSVPGARCCWAAQCGIGVRRDLEDVCSAIAGPGAGAPGFRAGLALPLDLDFCPLKDCSFFADMPSFHGAMSLPARARRRPSAIPAVRDVMELDSVDDTSPAFSRGGGRRVTAVPSERDQASWRAHSGVGEGDGTRIIDALLDLVVDENVNVGLPREERQRR